MKLTIKAFGAVGQITKPFPQGGKLWDFLSPNLQEKKNFIVWCYNCAWEGWLLKLEGEKHTIIKGSSEAVSAHLCACACACGFLGHYKEVFRTVCSAESWKEHVQSTQATKNCRKTVGCTTNHTFSIMRCWQTDWYEICLSKQLADDSRKKQVLSTFFLRFPTKIQWRQTDESALLPLKYVLL